MGNNRRVPRGEGQPALPALALGVVAPVGAGGGVLRTPGDPPAIDPDPSGVVLRGLRPERGEPAGLMADLGKGGEGIHQPAAADGPIQTRNLPDRVGGVGAADRRAAGDEPVVELGGGLGPRLQDDGAVGGVGAGDGLHDGGLDKAACRPVEPAGGAGGKVDHLAGGEDAAPVPRDLERCPTRRFQDGCVVARAIGARGRGCGREQGRRGEGGNRGKVNTGAGAEALVHGVEVAVADQGLADAVARPLALAGQPDEQGDERANLRVGARGRVLAGQFHADCLEIGIGGRFEQGPRRGHGAAPRIAPGPGLPRKAVAPRAVGEVDQLVDGAILADEEVARYLARGVGEPVQRTGV